MKTAALFIGILVLTGFVLSQGYGPCGYGCYSWNSDKLVVVQGELISVAPTQIKLKTQDRNRIYNLYMGPFWYFSRIGLKISPGDIIRVKGYQVQNSSGYHMYVSEVIVGGKTYRLRDQNGRPLWWDYRGKANIPGRNRGSGAGMGKGRRGGSGRW